MARPRTFADGREIGRSQRGGGLVGGFQQPGFQIGRDGERFGLLVAHGTEDIVDKQACISAIARLNLLPKEIFNVFGQCYRHENNMREQDSCVKRSSGRLTPLANLQFAQQEVEIVAGNGKAGGQGWKMLCCPRGGAIDGLGRELQSEQPFPLGFMGQMIVLQVVHAALVAQDGF